MCKYIRKLFTMVYTKFYLMWISYFSFIYSISVRQIVALKTINVEYCFHHSTENDTPSCTFHMSEESHDVVINCLRSGILQIIGDYNVVYINCSASYPLDFKFNGHKPTEAIDTLSRATVEKHSGGKFKSHHLDAKIFSIPSLHNYYASLHPQKEIIQSDSYNYSRTGSYIFSGYQEKQHLQSKLYIFFEEKSAIHTFLRNEDVVIRLPNLRNKTEENLPLVIPCRPSHLNAKVSLQQNGNRFHFNYDAVVGFTSDESWKSIIEKNPHFHFNEAVFTCVLNEENDGDLITFSAQTQRTKYGYDGLPSTEFASIFTNIETLHNGSLIIRHQCNFDPSSDRGSLALQDIPNPVKYRLIQYFIFPKFSSRSFSTTVFNTTLVYGTTIINDTATKSMSISVMCQDATTFQAAFVAVSTAATNIHLKHGFEASQAKHTGNFGTNYYFNIFHDQPNNVLYENQIVRFRCFIHSFTFIRPAIWYTERANGSVVEELIDYDWKDDYFSYAEICLVADVKKVLCAASMFHLPEWRNFSMDIKFAKSVKPTFDDTQMSIQIFPLNSNKVLRCTANGIPQPYIYWQRNDKNISSRVSFRNNTSILEFSDVQQKDAGDYVCIAGNVASQEKKIFTVQVFAETNLGLIIGSTISVCVCGALAALAAWVYFKSLKIGKAALSKQEINDFLNGEPTEINFTETNIDGNEYAHDVTHLLPYNTEFEIKQNRFRIDTSQVLGSGAFGMVILGTLDGIPVAVKTVKRNADKSYLKALLSELKVMTFLGDHENIVGIIGASTGNLRKGQLFIFVPFCALGSLQDYLTNNRGNFRNHLAKDVSLNAVSSPTVSSKVFLSNSNGYENITPIKYKETTLEADDTCSNIITITDLYQWATQIAQGMEYMSSRKVLHGDLAARNVLLTENRIAKITDFGLSRRLYDYSEYAKTQQVPLPWRWMSLESLRDLKFSTKSDVWSYGITLWEIFSLGQVPYPGCSWTMEFVQELENGMRLTCPQFAPIELYNTVMKECWHNDPQLRPSFMQLQEELKTYYCQY